MQQITVKLSDDVKRALDEASQQDGVLPEELVGRAVRQHLFLRRFRSLRERMSEKSRTNGVLTDEDVFSRVS